MTEVLKDFVSFNSQFEFQTCESAYFLTLHANMTLIAIESMNRMHCLIQLAIRSAVVGLLSLMPT